MLEIKQEEELLTEIWSDKKGRLVGVEPVNALYLTLDRPVPSISAVTRLVLDELANKRTNPLMWAMTWGMVVVGVGPEANLSCQINDVESDKNRQIVKLETTQLLNPRELIKNIPDVQGMGEIVINDVPTTIEGFLITYVHLIDQLVWVKYRSMLGSSQEDPDLYQKIVQEVREVGFKVTTASPTEILRSSQSDPNVVVRLYGSKVSQRVQNVMGAVRLSQSKNKGDAFINQLQVPEFPPGTGSRKDEIRNIPSGSESTVLASVTFGKELHSGHMLLLTVADLLRRGLGSSRPLTVINNNTGPRPAGMLAHLAAQNNLPIDQAAQLLAEGEVPCDKVIAAYRSRVEIGDQFREAFDLLETGKFDIFSLMARRVSNRLEDSGFDTTIVPESSGLSQKNKMLASTNPEWYGSGFTFAKDERGVVVLEKGGNLTATGKCLNSLLQAGRPLVLAKKEALMALVDSSGDTVDACRAFNNLKLPIKAAQIPGAGISFDGKVASGSLGEALTLSDLLDILSEEFDRQDLALSLRHLILTRPFTAENITYPDLRSSPYDFKDNRSFVRGLINCNIEAQELKKQVVSSLKDLQNRLGVQTVAEPKLDKWLQFMERRTSDLLAISRDLVISGMNKLRPVSTSGEFRRLEAGILKFMRRPNSDRARRLILSSLLQGGRSLSEIIGKLDQDEINLPSTFVGGNPLVRCEILEAVLWQGYRGDEAITKSLQYLQGPRGLVIRGNTFMTTLKGLAEKTGEFEQISEHDFSLMDTSMRFCLERLGYEAR